MSLETTQPALPAASPALVEAAPTKQQQSLTVSFPIYLLLSSEAVNNPFPCQHIPCNISSKLHPATLAHFILPSSLFKFRFMRFLEGQKGSYILIFRGSQKENRGQSSPCVLKEYYPSLMLRPLIADHSYSSPSAKTFSFHF